MNTRTLLFCSTLALLAASQGCANKPRRISVSAAQGSEYRLIDGFPRANKEQAVDLAVFYKNRTAESGETYILVGREGFKSGGVITESPDPAIFQIHHSAPTGRLNSGFMFISGQQTIIETDKTTVHSWGTRYIVWARPAAAGRPRQDVIFTMDRHEVCVTPGINLNIKGGDPCTSGTKLPALQYLTVTYAGGPPQISAAQPIASIRDQQILEFLAYVNQRAQEMGI